MIPKNFISSLQTKLNTHRLNTQENDEKKSVNVKSAPRNAEEVMDMFISEVNSFTFSKRKVETTENQNQNLLLVV